jgi:hypothetical protein
VVFHIDIFHLENKLSRLLIVSHCLLLLHRIDSTFKICNNHRDDKLCLQKCGMGSLFYFISELVDVGGLAHQRIDLFEIWFLFQYY